MKSVSEVRPSPIAGQWYSANPQHLAEQLDAYIATVKLAEAEGEIVAIMAPHAGHLYSGPVAAYAYAALQGMSPEIVAVIAPMHYPHPAPLLTTAHAAYATPLGQIPVDAGALKEIDVFLESAIGLHLARVANDPEHSVEIQLPFLQRVLKTPFRLVPIMVRQQTEEITQALGDALAKVLHNQNAVLVASTDLSHFYPQAIAETLDAEVLQQVQALNPRGVLQIELEGKGFACGRGALAAVLWAAQALGADSARVLHHATSGDVTQDYERVVGYGAAVITRPYKAES